MLVRGHEEFRIEMQRTIWRGVRFDQPRTNSFRIELLVPCRIERVRKVNSLAIATHLSHLRSAVQRKIGITRMWRSTNDSADLEYGCQLRAIRNRDIVTAQLSRSPARNIEPFIIQ